MLIGTVVESHLDIHWHLRGLPSGTVCAPQARTWVVEDAGVLYVTCPRCRELAPELAASVDPDKVSL